MKIAFYKIVIAFVFFQQLPGGKAQPTVSEELQSLLIHKTSFYDVKNTINDYYRSKRNITTDTIEKRK